MSSQGDDGSWDWVDNDLGDDNMENKNEKVQEEVADGLVPDADATAATDIATKNTTEDDNGLATNQAKTDQAPEHDSIGVTTAKYENAPEHNIFDRLDINTNTADSASHNKSGNEDNSISNNNLHQGEEEDIVVVESLDSNSSTDDEIQPIESNDDYYTKQSHTSINSAQSPNVSFTSDQVRSSTFTTPTRLDTNVRPGSRQLFTTPPPGSHARLDALYSSADGRYNSSLALVDNDAITASLPSTLQKLETKVLRRQQAMHTHLHQLSCDVARITAELAHVTMQRHGEMKQASQDVWNASINASRDSSMLYYDDKVDSSDQNNDDGSGGAQEGAVDISFASGSSMYDYTDLISRTNDVESSIVDCVHRQLDRQVRTNFDDHSIDMLRQDVALTTRQADKRLASIWRRWEHMPWAMRYEDERARRYAGIEMLRREIDSIYQIEEAERGQELLDQIAALRHRVAEERAERQRRDAKILQGIQQTAATMQEAFLEIYGD